MKGIDVSTIQKRVNWQKVAESGVGFAMIKATQGRGEGWATKHLKQFTDSQFKRNITEATKAGIPVGVYHYLTATTAYDAVTEAEYFCKVIAPYRDKITLWAAVDVESKYLDGIDRDKLTNIVEVFMANVGRLRFKPMLYTNPNFLVYRFLPHAFDDTEIWLAHWGVPKPYSVPNLRIWQYGTEAIPGVSGACDANNGYFVPPLKTYTIQPGDVYTNGVPVPARLIGQTFSVVTVRADRILLREINSWVRR